MGRMIRRRGIAGILVLILTLVGLAGLTEAVPVEAAQKPKLESTSITVAGGESKAVRINRITGSKVRRLTVASANTKIAKVKKSGKTAVKITGVKEGKSTRVKIKLSLKKKIQRRRLYRFMMKVEVKADEAATVPADVPAAEVPSDQPAATEVPGTSIASQSAITETSTGSAVSTAAAVSAASVSASGSSIDQAAVPDESSRQKKKEDTDFWHLLFRRMWNI